MKQLQDIAYKKARQKKQQSPQQKKAAADEIKLLVEEIPVAHLKLCRSASEQPTVKQRFKSNFIEEKIKQQVTVSALDHRQVVIPNKINIPNKKITLKKSENSDRILAKITLSQQAICSSIDQIM